MSLQERGSCKRVLELARSPSAVGGHTVLLFIMPTETRGAVYSGGGGGEKGSWNKL